MIERTGRVRLEAGRIGNDKLGKCADGWLHAGHIHGEWFDQPAGDLDLSGAPTLPDEIPCERCGLELTKDNASWFAGSDQEWRRPDTGQIGDRPEAFGPGAMFIANWKHCCFEHDPPCSEHLHVVLPNGGTWDIDGRANNCTMPDDKVHHCWVRHGEPPNVTIDKGGNICAAGAGSIQSGSYHGFLRNGEFT